MKVTRMGEIQARRAGKGCVISLPLECLGRSHRRVIANDGTITLIPALNEEAGNNVDCFVSGVQNGLNDLIHAKKWIKVTSPQGQAVMKRAYAYYTAGGGASGGGKKDDKWYFEAHRNHGGIEINPERMNEEKAVKEMKRGKDIMTLNDKLTKKLLERAYGNKNIGKLENHGLMKDGNIREGYFWHRHPENQHNHVWMWKME